MPGLAQVLTLILIVPLMALIAAQGLDFGDAHALQNDGLVGRAARGFDAHVADAHDALQRARGLIDRLDALVGHMSLALEDDATGVSLDVRADAGSSSIGSLDKASLRVRKIDDASTRAAVSALLSQSD